MSKIQKAFEGKKAFIPFITCGDPNLETTEQLVYAMERAGASLIELGIPFSDRTDFSRPHPYDRKRSFRFHLLCIIIGSYRY